MPYGKKGRPIPEPSRGRIRFLPRRLQHLEEYQSSFQSPQTNPDQSSTTQNPGLINLK